MDNANQSRGMLDILKLPLYDKGDAIFITGATGFLGGHYLYWKLHTQGKVYVLARGEDDAQARARVCANLSACAHSYNLPDIPESILSERLICVRGDLKQPGLGLEPSQLQNLMQAGICEIWHFAASLSFRWEDKDKIDATNIRGTEHLLTLCSQIAAKRFIYISTAYTAGKQSGIIPEALHSDSLGFTNYYEQSKWAAEQLISSYTQARGIDCTIVRPAIILGPELTQCSGGTRFGLYGLFQEMHQMRDTLSQVKRKLRLVGHPEAVGNFIPVDQVVLDLLYLRSINFGDQQVYHSVNSRDIKVFDVIKLCEQHNDLDCMELVVERQGKVSSFESLFDSKTRFYEGYYGTIKRFERALPPHKPMTLSSIENFIRLFADELDAQAKGQQMRRHQISSWDDEVLTVHSLGSPDNPAIIIANAYGMPVDFVTPLARRLSKSHFVLTWDTRWVPALTREFEADKCNSLTHAKDVIAIMDEFGLPTAAITGWSSGVQTCLRALHEYPHRLSCGILLNGGVSLRQPDLPVSQFEENLKSLLPKISANRRMAEFYCQLIYGNLDADKADEKAIDSVLTSTDPHLLYMTSMPFRNAESLYRYANMMHTMFNEREDAFTRGIKAPVMVLGCEQDEVTHPELARALAHRLPRGELVMLSDAGHFAQYYDAGIAKMLAEFAIRSQPHNEQILCQN
ncbi:alpha/beta fold hydrolase [Shewanella corallii]|uniref:Alpha/beta fold hydrolase n=1 Tax=Shewanella corallii TaxID=560080 RepID=A0ABT0N9F8_9GAMM|nr:alpha/beta fold hydrolase [Shewanella corallii]MCL2914491.1 alpha/beta fold hydrolase [Shewanella corallii]